MPNDCSTLTVTSAQSVLASGNINVPLIPALSCALNTVTPSIVHDRKNIKMAQLIFRMAANDLLSSSMKDHAGEMPLGRAAVEGLRGKRVEGVQAARAWGC